MPSHRPRSGSPTTSAARRRRRRCEPRIAALPGVGRSRRCSTWPPSWSEAWHCGMSGSTRQFGRPQPQLRSLPADWPIWLGETKGDVNALPRPGAGRGRRRKTCCVCMASQQEGRQRQERRARTARAARLVGGRRRFSRADWSLPVAAPHGSLASRRGAAGSVETMREATKHSMLFNRAPLRRRSARVPGPLGRGIQALSSAFANIFSPACFASSGR
jgi:hypothetical protein